MTFGETTIRDEQAWTPTLERLATAPGVTIAVAVYNGGELVRRCLESVIAHRGAARVIVIDDASPDPATREILDGFSRSGSIELVRHETNRGYTRTANHALDLAGDDDIVLLNSDTEVGPLWWQRLRWVAYSSERVATVSAASDNAGAMAIPRPGVENEWGHWLAWDEVSRWVARRQRIWDQDVPTAHGFCMYIRRQAADDIGYFDAQAFPRGYGEENDFSLRGTSRNWRHAWAPHVIVKHAKGVSFGSERESLMASARATVVSRFPDYENRVRRWRAHAGTQRLIESAALHQEELNTRASVLPRVLYVIHRAGGGTPATNADLMNGLADRQESYLLEAAGGQKVILSEMRGGELKVIEQWVPKTRFNVADGWREDYASYFAGLLTRLGIELVHVRHLINQPLTTVPRVCRLMGVRMILSTHDFYSICPTVHLLDENLVHCGGVCTPGHGRCTLTTTFIAEAPHPLKHSWVNIWQDRARTVLDIAETVIATTESAAQLHAKVYPEYEQKIQIVEHGRDVSEMQVVREPGARRPGPLRIVAIANWSIQKGPEYLRQLARRLGGDVEWHVLGARSDMLDDVAISHGRYTRETLGPLLREIDPDFSAILSISPETYSHTLTESWSMGVPVIATDLGAVADRIHKWGGGFVVQLDGVEAAVTKIRTYSRDPQLASSEFRPTPRHSIRSPRTMAEDYNSIYWHADRGPQADSTPRLPVVGFVVHGSGGKGHPPTAWIRLLRQMSHPEALKRARFRAVDPHDLVSGGDTSHYDVVLVQRDAVPGHLATALVEQLRLRGCPLVLELDDDLISDSAVASLVESGYDAATLDGVRTVAGAADRVIVSTADLAGHLHDISSNPLVIPNRLDPRLWYTDARPSESASGGAIRILYAGSATHARDLDLIWDLPALLSERVGQKVVLDIIGVTSGKLPPGMVRIRPPAASYPRYVPWLRGMSSRWSAAVAPLVDDPFTRAKSDVKLLEYAALGLPAVASASGPYRLAAPELATLVGDSIDDWVEACATLIVDPSLAASRARVADEYVRTNRIITAASTEHWLSNVLGTATDLEQ